MSNENINTPKNIRNPKTGTVAANYKYLVTADNKCVLYANLENNEAEITLPNLTAPAPGGGKGVFQAGAGWNSSNKYFQVSN